MRKPAIVDRRRRRRRQEAAVVLVGPRVGRVRTHVYISVSVQATRWPALQPSAAPFPDVLNNYFVGSSGSLKPWTRPLSERCAAGLRSGARRGAVTARSRPRAHGTLPHNVHVAPHVPPTPHTSLTSSISWIISLYSQRTARTPLRKVPASNMDALPESFRAQLRPTVILRLRYELAWHNTNNFRNEKNLTLFCLRLQTNDWTVGRHIWRLTKKKRSKTRLFILREERRYLLQQFLH